MSIVAELEERPGFGWVRKGSKATVEYCLEYTLDGTRWAMNFFAEDDDDAQKKVDGVRSSLCLSGRLNERIEWTPKVF